MDYAGNPRKLKLPVVIGVVIVAVALVGLAVGMGGRSHRTAAQIPSPASTDPTSLPDSSTVQAGGAGSTRPSTSSPSASSTARAALSASCASVPPPNLGLDAYRQLGHLSFLDLVSRASGQSTADPAANNADWTNPVRSLPSGGRVLLDQSGPGVVTFMRMQEDYGSPWRLTVDGSKPTTIAPSDLGRPANQGPVAAAFPLPLSFAPDQSRGSSLFMTPIPFQQSISLSSSSGNGNFYSLLRRLPYGTPVTAGTPNVSAADVAQAVQAGPGAFLPAGPSVASGSVGLKAFSSNQIADLQGQGQRQIRLLHFDVPASDAVALGNSTLRVWWDGEQSPSVDAPLKFLAGDAAGVYQPSGRPLVAGLLAKAGASGDHFSFDLLWPMPYRQEARISLVSNSPTDLSGVSWQVATEPFNAPSTWWAPLHATYTSIPNPQPGRDMTFLDVSGSGRIVGTVINFGHVGPTLEGNPRIFLDEADTPQVQATGTEEWGLGGNYWRGGQQVSLPLGGLPSADNNPAGADVDGAGLYRFLVADSIPFNRHAKVTWEHGALNSTTEPYRATVIWYGTPTPTALPSDDLAPGVPTSAAAHQFTGTGLRTTRLTSGYAYKSETMPHTLDMVGTSGTTSFTMSLSAGAVGAFLRRTYDTASTNQRADVYVDGVYAGTWYNAGQFSPVDPAGLKRQLMEDEFPLPGSLLAGKRTIKVELRNHPVAGLPSGLWTAARYQLYSMVAVGCTP